MTISAGRAGRRFASISCAGYSVTELVVVCAVIGLLAVMTIPFFVTYYQAAAARAGSQQVVALLNQARGLAVKENDSICVQLSSATQMRMRLAGCGGAIWVGPGTDAGGMMTLPQGFTLAQNEFLYALIFLAKSDVRTVPVGAITELIRGDVFYWGQLMAAALLGSVPVAIIYSFFVEHYVAGLTAGAVKS